MIGKTILDPSGSYYHYVYEWVMFVCSTRSSFLLLDKGWLFCFDGCDDFLALLLDYVLDAFISL
jgi:hypothetical protein